MTLSNSEKYLIKNGKLAEAGWNTEKPTPIVTPKMAKVVSAERRSILEEETLAGKFQEAGGRSKFSQMQNQTAMGTVTGFSSMQKTAASVSIGGGTNFRGAGGSVRMAPEVYSPLWITSNLNLPRDRATVNAWSRAFYALNAPVQNAISLHATYPISKMNIKCKNKHVEQFFSEMIEEIDLMNVCIQLSQEYWILGEAFPYAEFDQHSGKWSGIRLQNPDYISVLPTVVPSEPIISLRPDDNIKRIVSSNKPGDVQQRQLLNQQFIEHIKRGQNIPLSNFNISHIARKISPYDIRGTGLLVCIFKALMLWDKFRENKFAQADGFVNPLTLVQIGSEAYKPSPQDLEAFRDVLEQATNDKNFKIITHDAVKIEYPSPAGGIYDLSGDFERLLKEIYTGLVVPSVLMDGGSDVSYSNGSIALDVLKQRYLSFRNYVSHWLRRKIFAPISKIQDFYEFKDGKKILVVPDVDWNHMNLFDVDTYISTLKELSTGEKKHVSIQTLYRTLGLDYAEEQRKIRMETIDDAILEKETASLKLMTLAELRSLTPEDEIPELEEEGLMGEQKPEGEEEEGGFDLPGMGAPSAPPPMAPPPSAKPPAPKAPSGPPKK